MLLWTYLHFQSEIGMCLRMFLLQVWKPGIKKKKQNKQKTVLQANFFLFQLHVKAISIYLL